MKHTEIRVLVHKDICTTMFNTEVAIKGVCVGAEYPLIVLNKYSEFFLL